MLRRRNIVESTTPPSIDSLWLNKGTAKVFVNGKWVTIAGGESPNIELKIGNSESVKANNLAKLQDIQSVDHLFFANIDYGYGAAKWLPTTGGEAFIVTSSGRAITYTIGKDGSVTKASTDIDLTSPPDLSSYARLDDIGTEESFIFTLEDDSKVTKSIRVVSTTPAT